MRIRSIITGWMMLITAILYGCSDDINYVGGTIQPDGDKINVKVDSFMMNAETVKVDSIFAKSSSGFLGQFYDPKYGDYKSDFICQFYCQEDFKFTYEPIDGKIDSVDFVIFATSYIGDSLVPMKAEVFPVVKSLERNYYTNISPEDYCDMQNSLGGKGYTLYDPVTAVRKDTLIIPLKKELGQRIYDETINNPASFANQEAFNNFFPGLYVTNTYGMGNVIEVQSSVMMIYYSYVATTTATDGSDSTYVAKAGEPFIVTNEVIQMNRMKSYNLDQLLQPNDKYTYLKTPAGVFTRLTLPTKAVFETIGDRIINNVPLPIRTMPKETWEFATDPSTFMLLLPEDSLISFFENNKLYDEVTSYMVERSYSSTEKIYMYNFTNIARLLKTQRENAPEEDLRLLLVPVASDKQVSSSTGQISISYVRHYQKPTGITLRKEPEIMQFKVTTSSYDE